MCVLCLNSVLGTFFTSEIEGQQWCKSPELVWIPIGLNVRSEHRSCIGQAGCRNRAASNVVLHEDERFRQIEPLHLHSMALSARAAGTWGWRACGPQ